MIFLGTKNQELQARTRLDRTWLAVKDASGICYSVFDPPDGLQLVLWNEIWIEMKERVLEANR